MDSTILQDDLFETIEKLGQGASGDVWKVYRKGRPEVEYARKGFIVANQNDRKRFKEIRNEIMIIKRLRHAHIIEFVQSYQLEGNHGSINYFIVLFPVADFDLQTFFDRMAQPSTNALDRTNILRAMCEWPGCLLRALDYVHSMSIRHKDIKPGNILIKDMKVYLTDFGISRDFLDLTSKTDGTVGKMTRRYIAPEIDEERPRGRPTDVWALGCVFIELCTVASGENSIADLNDHLRGRRHSRWPPPYCEVPYPVFRWIWKLYACPGPDPIIEGYIQKLLQMAFLMLDPDPDQRITSRQLVDLMSDRSHKYFHLIAEEGWKRIHSINRKSFIRNT
ncbi:kinase-like domain-containing protein [Dendryphion nanum]|uniref:non-specific serine/threonine protein kinase n=1 Tax=Dendryphion nanum TaxID=256645 RepID=A0A9P9EJ40_9PLEO|nr:kinase-like domain-containing protein [Dendryphion nanum]